MKVVAVYCGSKSGNNSIYADKAVLMGKAIVKHRMTMVYGGGKVGLMGIIADAMIEEKGRVIGVTPQFLVDIEVHHKSLNELVLVETMAERKTHMIMLSEGFIAMPGSYGTMEEIFEVMTLSILKKHAYPIGLYNVNGYYDLLIQQIDHMVAEGFLAKAYRNDLIIEDDPEVLIRKMIAFEGTEFSKY
jgi:uncharacterized protein (TIGR00730 family)